MSIISTITTSCDIITVAATDQTSGASMTGDIIISDSFGSGTTIQKPIVFTAAGVYASVSFNVPTTMKGVITIELIQSGVVQQTSAVVKHCDLDCCLAKLVDELLSCSCECDKCNALLLKAQKIFLLLQSAKDSAKNVNGVSGGYLQDANAKYTKAIELCDMGCECGC
jgi:hypothetical protein